MKVAEVGGHLVEVGSPSTISALETEPKLSGLAEVFLLTELIVSPPHSHTFFFSVCH